MTIIWNRFKSWMLGVSVQVKIMGIATTCILLLGMAMTLQVRWWLIHHMNISEDIARGFTLRFIGVTIGVAFLGMGIAYLLTDIMTKPILRLVKISKAVTQGQLNQRAEVWANDEVGELTLAFNEMIASMESSVHTLQQKNDELRHLYDELRGRDKVRAQLLQKLITAQEEERQRVARELHDQTGQYLTALSLGLKTIEDASFKERVDQTKQLQEIVSQLMKDIHSLSWELRPAALDDWGLNTAIQRYVEELSLRFSVPIDFHSRGFSGLSAGRLPTHIETALYRIVQEALINSVKHANAKQISVLLERFPDLIAAIIEDDGGGFEVEAVMSSPKIESKLGLLGMEERAALVGGTLTIESTEGVGTTVFVKIPI